MQYKESLTIDILTSDAIQNNLEEKEEQLTDILNDQKEIIVQLLNCYDYYNDTHGQVYDCEIDEDTVYIDTTGKGGFKVDFKVYYYFGCDDLNKEYDQEMQIEIEINFQTREIEITGELWNEREPDEI